MSWRKRPRIDQPCPNRGLAHIRLGVARDEPKIHAIGSKVGKSMGGSDKRIVREFFTLDATRQLRTALSARFGSCQSLGGLRGDMETTYMAIEVTSPGRFTAVDRLLKAPAPGQVRIRVEACGVCHSDLATVSGQFPGVTYPRVPGHEIIGRIDVIGEGVTRWRVGQRVGVGFFGGEDGVCEPCRRGDFVNCKSPIIPGITVDGGYAEVMIAEARAIALIPDELSSAEAAPLLCAGVTTFNCLRNAGLRAGDLVAIQGIGGLGHLAVQFARHMGFKTVALARGADKEELAKQLGAHVYIDSAKEDASAALQRLGGADAILTTAPDGKAMGEVVGGLKDHGRLLVVGVAPDPIEVSTIPIVFGGRVISGSLSGTSIDEEDTLAFSVLQGVRPMIETVPLADAPAAYERMISGKARFRMVLVTSQ
ncbi:MAG: alcohol dehydrogenase [Acidobacteriaceae bacterium]|nr:alcohol dehydrogenase [Acidobacteriaceae bacterium]